MTAPLVIPLVGGGGEPVDLRRTLLSHGAVSLPPNVLRADGRALRTTLALPGLRPRTVDLTEATPGTVAVRVHGPGQTESVREAVTASVRHLLALDHDLSGFYAVARTDPLLAWAADGAGRMVRRQTVLEECVLSICTTNVAWSATVRMMTAIVEQLGAPAAGTALGAFPSAGALARAGEGFYRDVARAGYRAAYLHRLATLVAAREVEAERLLDDPDDLVVGKGLQALPGIGPYAASHVLMVRGRGSELVLDSWTRPTYARLLGLDAPPPDAEIRARFASYGRWAGLAFWLLLTRDWATDE